MCGKTFILTDKIEFFPDKDLERELNFNFRATGYVFNKTLEASIYRENLVKFGIGTQWKVNRIYTQKIVKNLRKQKPFLKKSRIHLHSGLYRPLDKSLQRILYA